VNCIIDISISLCHLLTFPTFLSLLSTFIACPS
jgi:hypothetical protein